MSVRAINNFRNCAVYPNNFSSFPLWVHFFSFLYVVLLLTYPAQYQPLWTFVGSGLKTFDESKMAMSEVMPEKAQWIKDSVASFNPTKNTVVLANGESVRQYSHR